MLILAAFWNRINSGAVSLVLGAAEPRIARKPTMGRRPESPSHEVRQLFFQSPRQPGLQFGAKVGRH